MFFLGFWVLKSPCLSELPASEESQPWSVLFLLYVSILFSFVVNLWLLQYWWVFFPFDLESSSENCLNYKNKCSIFLSSVSWALVVSCFFFFFILLWVIVQSGGRHGSPALHPLPSVVFMQEIQNFCKFDHTNDQQNTLGTTSKSLIRRKIFTLFFFFHCDRWVFSLLASWWQGEAVHVTVQGTLKVGCWRSTVARAIVTARMKNTVDPEAVPSAVAFVQHWCCWFSVRPHHLWFCLATFPRC